MSKCSLAVYVFHNMLKISVNLASVDIGYRRDSLDLTPYTACPCTVAPNTQYIRENNLSGAKHNV